MHICCCKTPMSWYTSYFNTIFRPMSFTGFMSDAIYYLGISEGWFFFCMCVCAFRYPYIKSIDCIILFVRTLSDGSFQFMVLSSTANDCMDLNGEFDNTSRWLSEQWTQPAWNFWAATQVAGSSLNSALECNQFMLKYIINLAMEGVRYVLMIRMAMNLHDWCQPLPFILDTSNFPIQFSYSCGVLHNT